MSVPQMLWRFVPARNRIENLNGQPATVRGIAAALEAHGDLVEFEAAASPGEAGLVRIDVLVQDGVLMRRFRLHVSEAVPDGRIERIIPYG